MVSKVKVDAIESTTGSGTIALNNQFSGMTVASLPTLTKTEMPTGSVLQVVQTIHSSEQITSTTSWVNTAVAASITPSSATNRIFILINGGVMIRNSSSNDALGELKIYKGAADVGHPVKKIRAYDYGASGINLNIPMSMSYIDTAGSTSSLTYTLWFRMVSGTDMRMHDGSSSTITLMEIAG